MEVDWKETFEEILISLRHETHTKGTLFETDIYNNAYLDTNYYEFEKNILITEVYIKIVHNNNTINLDLYDKISVKKEDIQIKNNNQCIILILKKKEKKLWGHLYFFSMFVTYKNYVYPNLLKCTKEEKDKIISLEQKFKTLINNRRIQSIDHLKKVLKKNKLLNDDFYKQLKDNAQKIQWELEKKKNEDFKIQKESVKKRAVDTIYEELDEKNETESNLYGEIDNNQNKPKIIESLFLGNDNTNKVIKLKFTELKKNQRPARESRNLKKPLANYSSTKNFFLIVLIEKAKKLFFKNSDFSSSLETLKSVKDNIQSGAELILNEHIKVLSNLSLLYLLTNDINNCIDCCDKCVDLINEEIKNYNTEEVYIDEDTIKNITPSKIINSLDDIKSKNYIQYLYIIYAIVVVRKIYAMIKKREVIEEVEKCFNSIKDIKKFLPHYFYQNIENDIFNLRNSYSLDTLIRIQVSGIDEIKEHLLKINSLMDDKKIPQNASLNFYIYLKRSFYLKNLNMFYTNIINIFLTLFCIIDKQNKIYNFLYNVDGFNLTQFLLDIFEYILLLKNNSILSAKVIEMENLRNQAKDNQTYQLNHHIINEEIISVLKILLTQNYHSEFQSALISNIALNKIMNLFINKNYDEISKKEAVHNNDHISISEQNEQPQGNDETNQNTIINSSHKISLPYSNIYFKNILYKMKKKNITMKNVSYSSLETNNLDIEIYSNDENYKKNVENMSELLKVNIAIKIIKTICYSFNLIQKTHKESIPDKIHLRNVMHVLLIDLSYSIWKLNNLSQTENIVSLLFLYFNFSFVYKYDTNEFIIDTHFKKKEESNNFNFMMLKDIQSQNHDTNTGWNISTDYIKHIVEQTFIHNFFADYKKYIESTKKKEQTKKKQASHCYNHNKMVLNTIYLIKKIKNNINKRKKNIKIIDIERNFLNNKFPEEIYHQMIPFLNNRSYYLDSIQYSILLLSYNYKSTITSSFNLEYLSVLKKYFTMSFFLKNYQKKNIHLNKDIPIIYQYLLKKYLSYFTQPFSVNFKTKKRNTFLQQYNTEHSEKYLISYIQAVIRKYKKIKIFRNINYCLRQIDADRMLIENSQKILTRYIDVLALDFHILNCFLQFSEQNLSPHSLINKGNPDLCYFDHKMIQESPLETFSKCNFKNVVKHYFMKFLKVKIIILNTKPFPY
ncbi:conserved Plasmodium protein, unknown function [Plasmodium yoelii]|uniref:Uncharacterized protein n=2 Tax=Plasmodium yoelii TaxID=5861 RepID=A0AAE9WVF0_PLAYO|nr:conserved Plasmodium protein, unknown function [Plasmodium yoelii]WBY59721.1 hypothetical protein Py17XNL_001302937 [Plasmodium yoelii yoelii]CDU19690.1 conserved Plasmodium protein, unknown function [Plasmodium yoelii]VTZ80447.1 conserved Plasmodium protein, unknown function [Plasmodium yoelii]|eukprot:XP_022813489.1 conserved Plasmodium protein, unknown function [Plasmodium yoelii]